MVGWIESLMDELKVEWTNGWLDGWMVGLIQYHNFPNKGLDGVPCQIYRESNQLKFYCSHRHDWLVFRGQGADNRFPGAHIS